MGAVVSVCSAGCTCHMLWPRTTHHTGRAPVLPMVEAHIVCGGTWKQASTSSTTRKRVAARSKGGRPPCSASASAGGVATTTCALRSALSPRAASASSPSSTPRTWLHQHVLLTRDVRSAHSTVSRHLDKHLAASDALLPSTPVSMQHDAPNTCSPGGMTASRCSSMNEGTMRTGSCRVGPAHLQAARAGVSETCCPAAPGCRSPPWGSRQTGGTPAARSAPPARVWAPAPHTEAPADGDVDKWGRHHSPANGMSLHPVQLPHEIHTGWPATAAMIRCFCNSHCECCRQHHVAKVACLKL
jgi:hypothetical protein